MQELRSPTQEAAEDIFFGQAAIIWARWFVILAGTILALWSATEVSQLVVSILMVVALMAINFFVHGRYLLERPVNTVLLAALSFLDLIIITVIILAWRGQIGLASPFFVFYYPVVLAVAFVFPPRLSSVYLVFTLAMFAGAVFISDPGILSSSADLEVMATRVITLAATGLLGTYYWRIQRRRRRDALGLSPSVSES